MNRSTNYKLPLYAESGPADLIGGYNVAVTGIDSQMKANADNAAAAAATANAAKATAEDVFKKASTDKTVTVEQLAALKITANGIVYVG